MEPWRMRLVIEWIAVVVIELLIFSFKFGGLDSVIAWVFEPGARRIYPFFAIPLAIALVIDKIIFNWKE